MTSECGNYQDLSREVLHRQIPLMGGGIVVFTAIFMIINATSDYDTWDGLCPAEGACYTMDPYGDYAVQAYCMSYKDDPGCKCSKATIAGCVFMLLSLLSAAGGTWAAHLRLLTPPERTNAPSSASGAGTAERVPVAAMGASILFQILALAITLGTCTRSEEGIEAVNGGVLVHVLLCGAGYRQIRLIMAAMALQPPRAVEVLQPGLSQPTQIPSHAAAAPVAPALPTGWTSAIDQSTGKPYYISPDQTTQWEPPQPQAAPAGLGGPALGPASTAATPRFCFSCGAALQPGVKFCPSCGTAVA